VSLSIVIGRAEPRNSERFPQLLYSAPDVKHDPANHNYARPAVKRGGPQSFLCSAGVIPSSQPCAKPVLPRTGDVKDGAATAKGGLSLTAPSTEACWIPLGPRKFLMPLAGPCFSSGWARRPSQDGMRKDEAERSEGRPCRCSYGRHKLRSDLASSFVPRGTPSARGSGNQSLRLSVYASLAVLSGQGRFLFRPAEFRAINPDTVHDDGKSAR
jgi:hypothetical protein